MNKKVITLNPSMDKRWDDFVMSHVNGNIYHHSAWKEVIENSFGYRAIYFALANKEDRIVGGIPFFWVKSFLTGNRLVSLSFSDYCPILYNEPEDLAFIFSVLFEKARYLNASKIEIRLREQEVNLNEYEFRLISRYKNHILHVDKPPDVILKTKIHKSIRYDIKKANNNGLQVFFATSERDLKDYYELYVLTRRHHGLPPIPYIFFRNIWNILYPKGMMSLILVNGDENPIAGILFLKFKDTLYAISNSSDRKYLDMRPNHLLWWKGIEIAYQMGMKYFDFGRTSINNIGLASFKRRWGTDEYDLMYYSFGYSKSDKVESIKGKKTAHVLFPIFKVLPFNILKIIGKLVYKHLG